MLQPYNLSKNFTLDMADKLVIIHHYIYISRRILNLKD